MIQSYIFDLYGTLVDIRTDETMPLLWKRMALLLSLQGAPYGPEELRSAYRLAVEEQIDRRAAERPQVPRAHVEPEILNVFRSLYEDKGVLPREDRLMDTALYFRTLSMRHLRLYPGAREVLEALRRKGKGVYLLSNAQAAFTMPELRKLGLVPCFDGVVLSSDAGVKKPDAAIFDCILSRYGLDPKECLMIGNDAEADMLGAVRAGMAGRYIHTKQSPPRMGPLPDGCREIRSLRELL